MRKMNEIGCGIGYCSRLKSKILLETKLDTDGGLGSIRAWQGPFLPFPRCQAKRNGGCCMLQAVRCAQHIAASSAGSSLSYSGTTSL